MLSHRTELRRMAALQDRVPECGAVASRRVFCQSWRADVVAVTKSDGTPIEYVRYSAYGEPTVYPVADLNMDGVVNSTDSSLWSDLLYSISNASVYADSDLDFDGLDDWNSGGADGDLFYENYNENLGLSGVGRVSSAGVANRVGYAGYQWDQTISACHVRYRVYLPDIGRWTRRDPLGYVDGMGLYEYAKGRPGASTDALGLLANSFVNYEFNAFIAANALDTIDPKTGWHFRPEPGVGTLPGGGPWLFKTDGRGHGERGTSRISLRGVVDSMAIGTRGVLSMSRPSHSGDASVRWDPKRSIYKEDHGEIRCFYAVRPTGPCQHSITASCAGTYPWALPPGKQFGSVLIDLTIRVSIVSRDATGGGCDLLWEWTGSHSQFPSFEGILDGPYSPRHLSYGHREVGFLPTPIALNLRKQIGGGERIRVATCSPGCP